MMRTQVRSDSLTASRTGFSLVEILIVIGIIGLMVVLIVFAMGPSLQTARINSTRTTIAKLHDIIQKRVDAIIRMDVSVEAKKLAGMNSGLSEKAAEFLIRQNLYKQALPQRPEDLTGLDGPNGGGSDNAPIRAAWINAGGQATSPTSPIDRELNSELLLFALTQGGQLRVLPNGKSYTVPTLDIGQINTRHVQDTDGNGLNEFVDAWNQPLRFYSAPTRLIRSGGPNSMPPPALSPITATDLQRASILISGLPNDTSDTGPNGRDPFDPTGTLSTTSFFASSFSLSSKDINNNNLTLNNCPAFGETEYHTPNTYYVPLIVSIGPDGQSGAANPLGLFEPTDITAAGRHLGMVDTANADGLTDNITNRQQ